jgi:hypothetical protein
MSQQKPSKKKKVVVTTQKKAPVKTRAKGRETAVAQDAPSRLIFDRQNYMWILAGVGLMALGMLLMAGGKMPSPDVWDENLIYSWRRTVLAPFIILVGIGVEVYAIFKK